MRAVAAASSAHNSTVGRRETTEAWGRAEPVAAWSTAPPAPTLPPLEPPSAPEVVLAALSSPPSTPDSDEPPTLLHLGLEEEGGAEGEHECISPHAYQNSWGKHASPALAIGGREATLDGWTEAEIESVRQLFAKCDSTSAARRSDDADEDAGEELLHASDSESSAGALSPHRLKVHGELQRARAKGASLARARTNTDGPGLSNLEHLCITDVASMEPGSCSVETDPSSVESSGRSGACMSVTVGSAVEVGADITPPPGCFGALSGPEALETAASTCGISQADAPSRLRMNVASNVETSLDQAPSTGAGKIALASGHGNGISMQTRPLAKAPVAPSKRAAEAYQARVEAGVAKAEAARAASERAKRLVKMMSETPATTSAAIALASASAGTGVSASRGGTSHEQTNTAATARAAAVAAAAMRAELARNSAPRRVRAGVASAPGRSSGSTLHGAGAKVALSKVARVPLSSVKGADEGAHTGVRSAAIVSQECLDMVRRKPSHSRLPEPTIGNTFF